MSKRIGTASAAAMLLGTVACGNAGDANQQSSLGGAPVDVPATAGANPGSGGMAATAGNAANAAGTDTGGGMNAAGMNAGAGTAGAGGTASGGAGNPPTVDGALFSVTSELANATDAKAPSTVGIVTWTAATLKVTSAYIEFGRDTTYGTKAPVDLTQTNYRTLLLGMKPKTVYHFRVVASDGSASHASTDYTIETGAATTAVSIAGFDVKQDTGREHGFIVMSYWAGTGSSVAFILDADGDIVWAYDLGMPGGIGRARMSYSGHDMWATSADNGGQSLRRVGMDGLNAQTYTSTKASHDIAAVSGDTMAYLDYSVSCNDINEIDPTGTTKKIFTASAVFGNQCHGNAIRYSEAEDEYTFSVVDKDVIRVDRSGQKLWSLVSTVSGGSASWGGVNHGHHLLASSLLIFANKGGANETSAMIEYDFTGKKIASYESGATSANLGDVQRLPGGNTLIDFSNANVVHQVDAQGKLLVEIKGAGQNKFGYATWRPSLYGSSPDITD